MPNKNDISTIKIKQKNSLPKITSLPMEPILSGGKPGRKPKSLEEKESETVSLKLTKEEFKNLKSRSGLVPVATFVKHHLRNKTDLLS